MVDTILSLRDISYSYDDGTSALNNVSLDIKKGEKISVIGSNGAGKSTLFLICNGVIVPHSGTLFFKDEKINYKKADLRRLRAGVGIVFQEAENQIIATTVEGEISFGPFNLGLQLKDVDNRVNTAMKEMSLLDFAQRSPHFLSGGEKKRVTIADILAMSPEVILFDEPASSLDPYNAKLLEKTLSTLSKNGITIVVSTHDMDFAYRFSDRVIVFDNGEIKADGVPSDVFSKENIINDAGLNKPVIYEISQTLFGDLGLDTPKNMTELKDKIKIKYPI